MIIISYMGFKSAKGELPESFVMPFGRPKGLILAMLNNAIYVVMAIFMAPTFMDMYSQESSPGFLLP